MLNILLTLALAMSTYIVGVYILILAHECGHAIAGRLAGFYVTSFGMGTGRPLFVLRLPGGTTFYIGRERPWQGIAWVTSPRLHPPRRKTAVLLLGGPLANLLSGGLYGLILAQGHAPKWLTVVLSVLMVLNILAGLANLLPLSVTLGKMTLRSDGAQTLALIPRRGTTRPFQSPEAYLSLRSLWESIGDTTQLYVNLLTAALTACDLKDHAQARRLLEEARNIPIPENVLPLHRIYATLAEGIILQQEGDLSGGLRLIQQAEADFAAHGNETMRLLATATREDPDALSQMENLSDHPLILRIPAYRVAVAAAHLLLAMRYDTGDIETLLARYESARSWYRYMPTEWHVYSALTRYREGQGDLGGAAIAYDKAAQAASSIFETLENDPATQESFAERVQPLLTDGAGCLERLGRHGEANILRAMVPTAERIPAWRETATKKTKDKELAEAGKERRQFRIGLSLWTFDFVLATLALLAQWFFQPEVEWIRKTLLVVFLSRLISVVGCLVIVGWLSIRWLLTRKPLSAGKTAVYLFSVIGTAWILIPYFARR